MARRFHARGWRCAQFSVRFTSPKNDDARILEADSLTAVQRAEVSAMRHVVLTIMLAVLTACAAGSDPGQKCPDDPHKQLTRAEWKACYGEQEEDTQ